MKMENPRVSVVRFDTRDIIATSGGGGFIPSGIDVLWLTPESIAYYNKTNTNDIYDLLVDDGIGQPFYFNGHITKSSVGQRTWILYTDTELAQYYAQSGTMGADASYTPVTNTQEYQAVYDWLLAHRY